MRRPRFFFTVVIWALLICCDQSSDSSLAYPSTYSTDELRWLGNYRVFTRDGEIKDALLSRNLFVEDTVYHNQLVRFRKYERPFDSVEFLDSHNAVQHRGYRKYKYSVVQSAGQLFLTGNDTIRGYTYGEVFTRQLTYYLGAVKPEVYAEVLTSSTAGNFAFTYSMREKLVMHRSGEQLSIPVVIWSKRIHGPYIIGHWYTGSSLMNNLQGDFYKYLLEGDTVAITQYEFRLKRLPN